MSRPRSSHDTTRLRIIDAAEEQFRRLGYSKTAVADIAAALEMSPANIYRFFPSKSAINEAICHRFLEECDAMVQGIVTGPGTPPERLAAMIRELHRYNCSRYIEEQRVHEMVRVAMQENWQAIETHLMAVIAAFGTLIEEGVATGHFAPCDVPSTAMTVKQASSCILHPVSISECLSHGRDMHEMCERLISFVLRALEARPETVR